LCGERDNLAQLLAAPPGDAPLDSALLLRALGGSGRR
jgi:hypothetical protein